MHSGAWFDNRFRLDEPLGRGATSEVWLTTGRDGDRYVLKRLRSDALSQPELCARFAAELGAARRLGPPHFLELIEGRADTVFYIVWRHVDGCVLLEWIERSVPSPALETRLVVLTNLLEAVCELHAAGIVHRDLKPEHVLVPPGHRAILLDLGIARLDSVSCGLTGSRHLLGSAPYMAPEQIHSAARVDVRADLYSVGAIAFWLLSGVLPFRAPSAAALLALKELCEAPDLNDVVDGTFSEPLAVWVGRMLARDPRARFESATRARAALAVTPEIVHCLR